MDPRNTIIKEGCEYVPVPYELVGDQTAANIYNIDLVRCGNISEYDWVFISAVQTWTTLIKGDLPDMFQPGFRCLRNFAGEDIMECGYVDDLVIVFSVGPIDGPGKLVGGASPFYVRSQWFLPFSGVMEFDVDDFTLMLSSGILEAVVLHELGHVIGFGAVWPNLGWLTPWNCRDITVYPLNASVSPAPSFGGRGANASLAMVDPNNLWNLDRVPVEDSGSRGTRCVHWEETIFRTELMTGFISLNGSNPLSYTTARSMSDIGYKIDLDSPAIDKTFELSGSAPALRSLASAAKSGQSFELKDCLDHWDHDAQVPKVVSRNRRRGLEEWTATDAVFRGWDVV